MKKQSRISETISCILTIILTAGLVGLCAGLPFFVRGTVYEKWISTCFSSVFGVENPPEIWLVLLLAYAVIAGGFAACFCMFRILKRVRQGQIFATPSAAVIKWLSVCCFYESVVFAVLAIWFTLSAVIAFSALFLGIALLVVSNVIAAGTEIKQENDFTV